MAELVERSDLPVGQQSKEETWEIEEAFDGLPSQGKVVRKVKIFTEDGWGAEVARVRAQVAEDIAKAIERRGSAIYTWEAAAIARKHAGKGLPGHAAALPDVVGTPDHPEPEESR